MGDVPHGTLGGYNNHRCRCDACRAAKAESQRDYKRRAREKKAELARSGTHGTYTMYVIFGCRCLFCKHYNAAKKRRRLARRKGTFKGPKAPILHPLSNKRAVQVDKGKPAFLGRTPHITLTPAERMEYGVTLTVREQETLKVEAFCVNGPVMSALKEACDRIDAAEGDWKIVSISTPSSIFRDLQGAHSKNRATPEQERLGRIGRADLLEPRPFGFARSV